MAIVYVVEKRFSSWLASPSEDFFRFSERKG
jgi:hypothetical protein